jgi:hypothetical protein
MSVSQEEVVWAFKSILGRVPESEAVIGIHMRCTNFAALREALLSSEEFSRILQQTIKLPRSEGAAGRMTK